MVRWKADAAFYNTVMNQIKLCKAGTYTEDALYRAIPKIKAGADKKVLEASARVATSAPLPRTRVVSMLLQRLRPLPLSLLLLLPAVLLFPSLRPKSRALPKPLRL